MEHLEPYIGYIWPSLIFTLYEGLNFQDFVNWVDHMFIKCLDLGAMPLPCLESDFNEILSTESKGYLNYALNFWVHVRTIYVQC